MLLLTIGLACVCLGQNVKTPAAAKTAPSQNPYPNELPGFKFYVFHPLRPYASDRTLVAKVLGSDRDIELSRWKITPLFIGEGSKFNDHPQAKDITGWRAST